MSDGLVVPRPRKSPHESGQGRPGEEEGDTWAAEVSLVADLRDQRFEAMCCIHRPWAMRRAKHCTVSSADSCSSAEHASIRFIARPKSSTARPSGSHSTPTVSHCTRPSARRAGAARCSPDLNAYEARLDVLAGRGRTVAVELGRVREQYLAYAARPELRDTSELDCTNAAFPDQGTLA